MLNTIPTVIEFLHDISMKGSERERYDFNQIYSDRNKSKLKKNDIFYVPYIFIIESLETYLIATD